MKFYTITHGDVSEDGHAAYATLDAAKKDAREIANNSGDEVTVDRVEAATDRAGIIKLANGRGWCLSREPVFTAKPRKRKET